MTRYLLDTTGLIGFSKEVVALEGTCLNEIGTAGSQLLRATLTTA